ncbi:hypothetical protein Tdes44962_MAKER05348 [Teratosphaeria destructans]|uniref:Uncharacterized protein n=1 Tax=Teratosphaeria destructans TaxID=418781 RepID=A0A9W7VZ93_9PEZI|nr:hypothetical protein Tdes44962_MAKER05348 [Teratosphaeria destructans]
MPNTRMRPCRATYLVTQPLDRGLGLFELSLGLAQFCHEIASSIIIFSGKSQIANERNGVLLFSNDAFKLSDAALLVLHLLLLLKEPLALHIKVLREATLEIGTHTLDLFGGADFAKLAFVLEARRGGRVVCICHPDGTLLA